MRVSVALFALLALAIAACGEDPADKKFSGPEGDFKIAFPGKPTESTAPR